MTTALPPMPVNTTQSATVHDGKTGKTTVLVVKTAIANPDGTVTVVHYDDTFATYPDEATMRAETDHQGLVFTHEALAFQKLVQDLAPTPQWVRGNFETAPHPLLADYQAAVDARDIDASLAAIAAFNVKQGYAGYAGSHDEDARAAVIVEVTRDVATKGGRRLLVGDVALAFPRSGGEVSVYSARSKGGVITDRRHVRVIFSR